jgi:predicted NACHT family NTPase
VLKIAQIRSMSYSIEPDRTGARMTIEVGMLIQKGAEVAVAELTKRAISFFKPGANSNRSAKELDFSKHFEYAFDRCTNIRTILKPDSQVKLLSCYVNLNHKIENRIYDDFEFIDLINEKKRVIVTGEGGGGKSMFMRYLWITMAETSSQKIPVFIELKNLKSGLKLLDYIYYASAASDDREGLQKFTHLMKDGRFVFIFDGFDEIKIASRETVQAEIFDLSEEYNKNIFVISGRSDDRYNGWSRFTRSKVCPLNKKQTLLLLERIDYIPDITAEFIAKVKIDAFEPQKSFLERPLLLCMMLVTYKHFREIPSKLHLFYSNAFDALYREHDSFKDGFKRDLHLKIQPDVFRKILGYTSLFTYKDQKIEFSGHELLEYINCGLKAASSMRKVARISRRSD